MWSNPHGTADLVIFTENILNGKLHFLCSDICVWVKFDKITWKVFNTIKKGKKSSSCEKDVEKILFFMLITLGQNKLGFVSTIFFRISQSFLSKHPAGNYMFKVNNRSARTRCEICSKLTIKSPERRHWLTLNM